MQLLLDHKEKAGQAKASFRSSMATTFHQLLRSTGRRRRNIYARVGTGSRSSSRRWDHPPAYSEGSFCSKGSLQQAALFHSFSIYPTSLSQIAGAFLSKRGAGPFSLKGLHYDSTSPISEMYQWHSPQEHHKATLQVAGFLQASFHPSRNCTKSFVHHIANSALESELELPIEETARPQVLKTKKLTKTAKHIMEILDREAVETARKTKEIPDVQPGDIVQLRVEVPENKRRVSLLKGIVIARRNSGINTTFRIRRVLAGVGVEMVFPLYSPNIKEIKVLEKRKVRRAKLFYLRQKIARMSSV
ncbi:hypothetical protein O6H91_12G040500 [Diphasiastrum complanatum]|uniref:Uncharacterized protein n=1 Tax=Diphasiastrum complanatum TaxID=34168 RepID=A0ACC2C0P8_DIPCM|nr:hypothetical protein O6H91_12G040500 [Diphasiastrum complanatum]